MVRMCVRHVIKLLKSYRLAEPWSTKLVFYEAPGDHVGTFLRRCMWMDLVPDSHHILEVIFQCPQDILVEVEGKMPRDMALYNVKMCKRMNSRRKVYGSLHCYRDPYPHNSSGCIKVRRLECKKPLLLELYRLNLGKTIKERF
jgi:hypothetical protein